MLNYVLAEDEPPLVELARAAGASLSGFRFKGGAAVQLRRRNAGTLPENADIELRHGVFGLPQTMRRERDLWNRQDRPAPSPGGCGGGRHREMERALDGHLGGKSHREIVALLWGAEAVAD